MLNLKWSIFLYFLGWMNLFLAEQTQSFGKQEEPVQPVLLFIPQNQVGPGLLASNNS